MASLELQLFIVSAPKGERPRKRCVFRSYVVEQLKYGVKVKKKGKK